MSKKRITLSMLIEAGVINPPMKIYAAFRNKNFEGTIDKDGFVIVKNFRRYTSLSIAGGYVRASVSGSPKGQLDYRPTNGWTFWKYRNRSGMLVKIETLRDMWLERKTKV